MLPKLRAHLALGRRAWSRFKSGRSGTLLDARCAKVDDSPVHGNACFTVAVGFLLAAAAAAQQPTPLRDDLKSTVATQPQRYQGNREYWLAARTDGQRGDGSPGTPFDASSPEKIAILQDKHPENVTWHYLPGQYRMYGSIFRKRHTIGKNVQILGAGIDKTIIQTAASPEGTSSSGVLLGCDYDYAADGFQAFDFTVDCNGKALGGGSGFGGQGSNLRLERLKFVNWGTTTPGNECFVVFSFGHRAWAGHTFDSIVFDHCVFTEPMSGNKDGCTIAAILMPGGEEGTVTNAKITHCQFLNVASDFTYSHAFNAEDCFGNYVDGCATGTYYEPVQYETAPTYIHDNVYRNVAQGLHATFHVTGREAPIRFEHNQVIMRNAGARGAGVSISGDRGNQNHPVVDALSVKDNRFTGDAGFNGIFLNDRSLTVGSLTVTGNSINLDDRGREIMIADGVTSDPVVRSNLDADGRECQVNRP